ISLVAGSVLWLLRRAFAPLWLRLILSAVTAWLYTVAAGGGAPVLRAAIGFTLALLAAAVFRRVRILNILAAVALGFLACDPDQLFEPSFQLSFAAVAAIGALAAPILDRTSSILREAAGGIGRVRPSPLIEPRVSSLRVELRLLAETISLVTKMRPRLATGLVGIGGRTVAVAVEMTILSAGIQFALMVPTIVYFHRVPITGVAANLIAVPALNLAVGFGLSGLVAGSATLSGIAGGLVEWAESVVAWFARLEPAWRVATPPLWLMVLFTSVLAVFAVALRRKTKLALLPGLLSMMLATSMYVYEGGAGQSGWLEVSTIDVAQGDSLLVVFPDGKTMLVDGGGFPVFKGSTARRMDIGEQVVSPYLWQRGLRHIDVVAMTHAHEDHAQGLNAVVKNFRPKQLWTGAVRGTNPLVMEARRAGVEIVQPQAGYSRQFGGATVRALAPSADYVPASSAKNNDSLVLEITYGQRRFVLTGDAERAVEWELVASGRLGPVDVLKVGHHGSKSSTTPEFMDLAKPKFAMISVGDGNLYGHPHPDVLSRLKDAHTQVFRTDRDGLTRFLTDGNRLVAETK
ncbi:MAG TPA: ComEC/Rec2 family competence protein, partial [Bryobacteraceae bacterium]|nr:ComEC/Rec2 family competence protein [Bryobacteraceae bacterium]